MGGSGLLQVYNKSFIKLLRNFYPDYLWDATKFHAVPKRYWNSIENQKAQLQTMANQLSIQPNQIKNVLIPQILENLKIGTQYVLLTFTNMVVERS